MDPAGSMWAWAFDWCSAESRVFRAFRGGGWGVSALYLRAAYRDSRTPGDRTYRIGVRCARDLK